MKNDLQINFGVIRAIADDLGSYLKALDTIEEAIISTDALLQHSSGKTVEAIKANKTDLLKQIKEQREEIADLFSIFNDYYYDMISIIAPNAIHQMSRIDRVDIWANMRSIQIDVAYLLPISFGLIAAPDTAWAATEDEKAKWARNNTKLRHAYEELNSQIKTVEKLVDELWDYYHKKIVTYEQTDDAFASKAGKLYSKYSSATEQAKDIFFGLLKADADIAQGIDDFFNDTAAGIRSLIVGANYYTLAGVVYGVSKVFGATPPGWAADEWIRTSKVLIAILKDPTLIFEGIGQEWSDRLEQKGPFYTIGYLAAFVATIVAGAGEADGAEGVEGLEEGAGAVGEVSGAGENIPFKEIEDLSQSVQDSFNQYDSNGWQGNVPGQTSGTKAGRIYSNREGTLPSVDIEDSPITYKEFDVNNKLPNASRDAERFVVGSDGSVYYSDSHYGTITSPTGLPAFVKLK